MPIGVYKHKNGFHLNKQWKKRISLALKDRHDIGMFGKHHSDKTKNKMSKSQLGKKRTEETKNKMSKKKIDYFSNLNNRKRLSQKIKKLYQKNPSYKIKLRKANLGKKHSVETRIKIGKAQTGSKHWNWMGGISYEPYSLDWTKTLKRSIRERDRYVCQICSMIQNDITFDIHHIDYNKRNCNPNNLIILCKSCHSKTNINRKYWIKFFKERKLK